MHEHHLPVRRTARYFTLGHEREAVDEIWIVCHGYGQLASRFLKRFAPIDAEHRLIVAPEGLNRFYVGGRTGSHGPDARVGATWMTREDRLSDINDYVAWLDALHDAILADHDRTRLRLTVLGFSQGAATVSRWLALGRARADRLILWASSIPHEILPDGGPLFHGAPIAIVAGTADPLVPMTAVDAERRRLDALGIRYELHTFEGGHRIDSGMLERLAAAGSPGS